MRLLSLSLAMGLIMIWPVQADPVLKIINFTAKDCARCLSLNPHLDAAIARFPIGSIIRIDLDMTRARRAATPQQISTIHSEARKTAETHKAAHLWHRYGPITGLAVVIASDTGETINCLLHPMDTKEMINRLKLAKIMAERGTHGHRRLHKQPCPAPRAN